MHQRIGILGGTFNPVHYGHLAAAEEVRERLGLGQILFIPSFLPPHKHDETMPSAAQRMEMVRLAIAGNPRFSLSDIEVKRGGRSYTVDTIRSLQSTRPDAELFFITGLDSFIEIRTWHEWEKLLTLCSFVAISRPGYRFSDLLSIDFLKDAEGQIRDLDRGASREVRVVCQGFSVYLESIPHYEISSTEVRTRIREGRSIKYFLPDPVEHYIMNHKLYA